MSTPIAEDGDIGVPGAAYEVSGVTPLSNLSQRLFAVWWPAFFTAGLVEMLVFAFVDPQDLHWVGGAPVEFPRPAVYTVAFFAFWILVGLAGSVTQRLLRESGEINRLQVKRRYP
jgi:hypothetical protein